MKHQFILDEFAKHKTNLSENMRLRIHRSLSWLEKAKEAEDDLDICFISLWIAFNAVYAKDNQNNINHGDRVSFRDFIRLLQSKNTQALYDLIWTKYSSSIRLLLNNQYVFQGFWDYQNELITEQGWKTDFEESKQKSNIALASRDTERVLFIIFDRLYTLRNQIFHGGSTYNSHVNRQQLRDACSLLSDFIILFIEVMLHHTEDDSWGKPFYPYIKN